MTDWVDNVAIIRDANTEIAALEWKIDTAMSALVEQALAEAKLAYERVFTDGTPFPEWRYQWAIPSSGENVRLDFERTQEVSWNTRAIREARWDDSWSTIFDEKTWISFLGCHVDLPHPWNTLQVRVPLKHLSSSGIETVLVEEEA